MSDAARAQQIATAAGLSQTTNGEPPVLDQVTHTELAAAFETWLSRYEEHPEEFVGYREGETPYGDNCAYHLVRLLTEGRQSA